MLQSYSYGVLFEQFTSKQRDAETGLDYFGGSVYVERAWAVHKRRPSDG